MPYVLNVEARTEGRPAPPERRTVNASRMTIGRGAECSVCLHDEKKHVSRVHAVVDLQGGGHVLTVMSRVNPVIINGRKIGPGDSAPIKAEDVIEIGDFTMQLLELHEALPTPGASSTRQVAPSPFDFGLGGNGDTVPGDDPFRALDDLIAAKPTPAAPRPAPDPFELSPAKSGAGASSGLVAGVGGMSHLDLGRASDSTDPLVNLLNSPDISIREPGGGPTFNPQPLGGASLEDILGRGPATPIGQPLADLARHHPGGSSNIDHVQSISVAYTPQPLRAEARQADPFAGFDPFGSLVKPKSAEP